MFCPALSAALGLALALTSGAPGPSAHAVDAASARPRVLATAPLWPPPSGASPRHGRRHVPGLAPAPAPTPASTPGLAPADRRTGGATRGKSTEALEAEVFGSEPTPQVRRTPARDDDQRSGARGQNDDTDDDDTDDDQRSARGGRALADLPPVIAPRVMAFGLGTSLMGRSFSFDAPLQPESNFPRAGLLAQLESFPLLATRGWFARLGAGASFGTEIGSTGVGQPDGGTLSYPVSQRRWDLDLRYAIPVTARFLVVPRFGYGRSSYNLDRRAHPAPSTCAATSTQVCLPDVQVSHVALGFDARFAATPRLAIGLGAAFLPAFGVGRGMGQIGVESDTSASGLSGDLSVTWQLLDWLALRGSIPLVHYSYQFSGRTLAYHSASETYYGLTAGAVVFAR
jgi:hypothetical protein